MKESQEKISTREIRVLIDDFISFGRPGALDIGHPHPDSQYLCGCTFLDLLPSAGLRLWIFRIRIPTVNTFADALFLVWFLPPVQRAALHTCVHGNRSRARTASASSPFHVISPHTASCFALPPCHRHSHSVSYHSMLIPVVVS